MPGFMDCVQTSWSAPTRESNPAAIITEKFKRLRTDLKKWHIGLSRLKLLMNACNAVILAFDNLEEQRPLCRHEFNFRKIVKLHLEELLHL